MFQRQKLKSLVGLLIYNWISFSISINPSKNLGDCMLTILHNFKFLFLSFSASLTLQFNFIYLLII